MRASTIAKLAWYMPRHDSDAGLYVPASDALTERQTNDIMHYALCHKNLQFGWDFAQRLNAAKHIKFPAFLHKDDLFVWRAYKYMQGFEDPAVAGAVALTAKGNENLAADIQALLIAKTVTDHGYIASRLSLPVSVVAAYEKLFFNVLDRKNDHAYIASIVYPESRMVEVMKDYLEHTSINTLLMRSGYNHGEDIILYMMGIGQHPFKMYDAATGAAELDGLFMRDGILYAAAGLQNVPNSTPITNARLSINAGKMGKNEEQGGVAAISLEDTVRTELIEISQRKAKAMAFAADPVVEVKVTKQQH